jgi:hypothetical protein
LSRSNIACSTRCRSGLKIAADRRQTGGVDRFSEVVGQSLRLRQRKIVEVCPQLRLLLVEFLLLGRKRLGLDEARHLMDLPVRAGHRIGAALLVGRRAIGPDLIHVAQVCVGNRALDILTGLRARDLVRIRRRRSLWC